MPRTIFWEMIQSCNNITKCKNCGSIFLQKHNFLGAIVYKCWSIKCNQGGKVLPGGTIFLLHGPQEYRVIMLCYQFLVESNEIIFL